MESSRAIYLFPSELVDQAFVVRYAPHMHGPLFMFGAASNALFDTVPSTQKLGKWYHRGPIVRMD